MKPETKERLKWYGWHWGNSYRGTCTCNLCGQRFKGARGSDMDAFLRMMEHRVLIHPEDKISWIVRMLASEISEDDMSGGRMDHSKPRTRPTRFLLGLL